jgi:hypothetical protein
MLKMTIITIVLYTLLLAMLFVSAKKTTGGSNDIILQ